MQKERFVEDAKPYKMYCKCNTNATYVGDADALN